MLRAQTRSAPWIGNCSDILYWWTLLWFHAFLPHVRSDWSQTFGTKVSGRFNLNSQHAHPSRSWSRLMLIGSEKSPPNSSLSSCARAFLAMTSNACSTFTDSFALVSKYGMFPLLWQYVMALLLLIILLSSPMSILLPRTTKGNDSGSRGDAWIRNSSRQESRVSKDFGELTS